MAGIDGMASMASRSCEGANASTERPMQNARPQAQAQVLDRLRTPRCSPWCTGVLVHIWYMKARSRSSRRVVSGGHAAEGFSSACWATVTPSALAMSHSRARLVER